MTPMNNKALEYIESSVFSSLLSDPQITDISYNGKAVFYMHNTLGRKRWEINLSSDDANNFIRQIANLTEKQFSYSNPILDVSVANYRINAVHYAINKVRDSKAVSFSIRIASSAINLDKGFMNKDVEKFLKIAINKGKSFVIAGKTGTGKTELEKYLVSLFSDNSRAIIIDNIQELDSLNLLENLDILMWVVNPNSSSGMFSGLIKNALRNNPDWIIVAEARGEEMKDIINAPMSGHPIIITLHSKNIDDVLPRMARMIIAGDKTSTYEDALSDIASHIDYVLYVKRETEKGSIKRFIHSIGKFNEKRLVVEEIFNVDKSSDLLKKEISNLEKER